MFCMNPTDPFNKLQNRNIKNTPRGDYNCGGYALGTFSWYCPYPSDMANEMIDGWYEESEAWEKTMYMVSNMIVDFGGRVRMLYHKDQLEHNERLVLFRISSDGDFHYVVNKYNGYYHKRGACPSIETMTEEEVFETNWCWGRYDGPIVMLAVKK